MKMMKRILPFALVLVFLLFALVACGGGEGFPGDGAAEAPAIGTNGSASLNSSALAERKIIREYSIDMETKDFNKSVSDLRAAVADVKGYEESARVTPPSNTRKGYANIVFRIPTDEIDAFNEAISGIGSISEQNITSKDVTLTYADVEARIVTLEAEQTRLLQLYNQASSPSETMKIYERLTVVESDLSSYRSQLSKLQGSISMTKYTFYISDVEEYTEETNFFVQIGGAIVGSLKVFWNFIKGAIIAAIYVLPFAAFLATIITGIIHLIRMKTLRARRAAKRAAKLAARAQAQVTAPPATNPPTGQTPPTGE